MGKFRNLLIYAAFFCEAIAIPKNNNREGQASMLDLLSANVTQQADKASSPIVIDARQVRDKRTLLGKRKIWISKKISSFSHLSNLLTTKLSGLGGYNYGGSYSCCPTHSASTNHNSIQPSLLFSRFWSPSYRRYSSSSYVPNPPYIPPPPIPQAPYIPPPHIPQIQPPHIPHIPPPHIEHH